MWVARELSVDGLHTVHSEETNALLEEWLDADSTPMAIRLREGAAELETAAVYQGAVFNRRSLADRLVVAEGAVASREFVLLWLEALPQELNSSSLILLSGPAI